jgi:hypothetical protein
MELIIVQIQIHINNSPNHCELLDSIVTLVASRLPVTLNCIRNQA